MSHRHPCRKYEMLQTFSLQSAGAAAAAAAAAVTAAIGSVGHRAGQISSILFTGFHYVK